MELNVVEYITPTQHAAMSPFAWSHCIYVRFTQNEMEPCVRRNNGRRLIITQSLIC